MALFGDKKRTVAQRLQASEWTSEIEQRILLDQLRGEGPKPAEILFLLTHGDPVCRQFGATLMRAGASVEILELLAREADGKPEPLRRALLAPVSSFPSLLVAEGIERMIDPRSVQPVQRAGWQLAFELPDAGRRWVEKGLGSAIAAVRLAALQRFIAAPQGDLVARLLDLIDDESDAVRQKVVEALAASSDPRAVGGLFARAVAEPAPLLRKACVEHVIRAVTARPALADEKLLPLCAERDDAIRRAAIEVLVRCRPLRDAVMAVLEHATRLPGWVRARPIATLAALGEPIVPIVAQALQHRAPEVRLQALALVEALRNPRLVPSVTPLLRDADWWLRIVAAHALGMLGGEAAADALVPALEDPEVRLAALEALATIGSPRSLKSVAGLLRDPEAEIRREAVSALGRFSDARILPVLKQVFERDPDDEVRDRALDVSRALAERLAVPAPITAAAGRERVLRPIDRLLMSARDQGAGDVHLSVGQRPWLRIGSELAPQGDLPLLDSETLRDWLTPLLDETRRRQLADAGEVDFCHVIRGVGRCRCSLFEERGGLAASFRLIPVAPPTLGDVGLPAELSELLDHHRGLVVISGPAGSGKTTTLAALVNLINETQATHVLTVEDPIEFVHAPRSALVNQRQAGRHTAGFASALKAALREDPDVIVIGEMRDLETVRMALTAAETGHLVIATMQTTGAVATVDRLIDAFPEGEQAQVRAALSDALKYVISQSLVARREGGRRAAVFEVLKVNLSVANLIREGKTFQIPSVMQTGRASGMITVDQALQALLDNGDIGLDVALDRAEKKELFAC